MSDRGFESHIALCACLQAKKHLSFTWFQQKVVANFCWIFCYDFLLIFPFASGNSPVVDWCPVQVGDLYADETKKTSPMSLALLGKKHATRNSLGESVIPSSLNDSKSNLMKQTLEQKHSYCNHFVILFRHSVSWMTISTVSFGV